MNTTHDMWLTRVSTKVANLPTKGRQQAVAIAHGATAKKLQEPPFGLTSELAARVVKQTYEMFEIPSDGGRSKRRELLTKVLKQYALDNPQDRAGLEELKSDAQEEPVP